MRKTHLLRPRILGYRKDGRPIHRIAGASPDDPANDPKPADDPPKDEPKPDPKPEPEKTFTQADVDRIVTGRLSKFSDYDDLKKKAQAHDKALEAAKSEQEKAVDAARKEGESTATQRANTRLVGAEVRAQAAGARFHDPTDAIAQLQSAGKLEGIKVADDGSVDADTVKGLLKELADAKPYLVASDDGKPPPSFGGGPRKTEPARAGSLGEAIRNKIAAADR